MKTQWTMAALAALLACAAVPAFAQQNSPGTGVYGSPPVTISSGPAQGTATTTPVATSTRTASGSGGIWHQDCDADVQKLCPGLKSRAEVTKCLDAHTAQLSPACRDIRAKEEQEWKSRRGKKR